MRLKTVKITLNKISILISKTTYQFQNKNNSNFCTLYIQRIVYCQFSSHLPSHVPICNSVILCYTLLYSALLCNYAQVKSHEFCRTLKRHSGSPLLNVFIV